MQRRRRMPDFKTCRNKNKGVVKSFHKYSLRQLEGKKPLSEAIGLAESSTQAMYILCRMKACAEEFDLGFSGFFVTDDDQYYFITTTLKENCEV